MTNTTIKAMMETKKGQYTAFSAMVKALKEAEAATETFLSTIDEDDKEALTTEELAKLWRIWEVKYSLEGEADRIRKEVLEA